MKKFPLLIILGVMILTAFSGCNKPVFNGNRTNNDTQFVEDYTVLNQTEMHEMSLEKGAVINVSIVNKSGHLHVLVTDPSGKEIYQADDASSGDFSLEIPESGTYSFSVTGVDAKGSFSFIVAE